MQHLRRELRTRFMVTKPLEPSIELSPDQIQMFAEAASLGRWNRLAIWLTSITMAVLSVGVTLDWWGTK